jgi:hypothetical protein
MTTLIAYPLTPTVTPCSLLHNRAEVTSYVTLAELDSSRDIFDVARCSDWSDSALSVTFAPEQITITVNEPTTLVLDSNSELERHLPPLVIMTRNGSSCATFRRFNLGTAKLEAPIVVTRSGLETDLIIGVNFNGSSTCALPPPEGAYCQLSWRVNSRPRSLRFAAATSSSGVPLILRPKRED